MKFLTDHLYSRSPLDGTRYQRFLSSHDIGEHLSVDGYYETVMFERRYPDTDMFGGKRVRYPF